MDDSVKTAKLIVTFGGLCLFAYDEGPAGGGPARMHALLPDVGPGSPLGHEHTHEGGQPVPPHNALLAYDAHLEGKATPASAGLVECRAVRGYELAIDYVRPAGLPTGLAPTLLPRDGIPDIADVAGLPDTTVPRAFVTPAKPGTHQAPPTLATRLTLAEGSLTPRRLPDVGVDLRWENSLGGTSRDPKYWSGELAASVEWAVDIDPSRPVTIRRLRLTDGTQDGDALELDPRGQDVRLQLLNATEAPHSSGAEPDGGDYKKGHQADHFHAYYAAFFQPPVLAAARRPVLMASVKKNPVPANTTLCTPAPGAPTGGWAGTPLAIRTVRVSVCTVAGGRVAHSA